MTIKVAEGVVEITADADDVPRDIARSLDGGSSAVSGSGGRLGTIFGGSFLGNFAANAVNQIVGGALDAVGDAMRGALDFTVGGVGFASDLSETRAAVDQVFGPEVSGLIQDWASNANAAIGQTQQQALAGAQTFGIFGAAAGLTGNDLGAFSTDLVGLAGDLASFKNTSPEQALEALGAGLRGESEPLRTYGILLDDATLRAKALELGIYDGNGTLTQQQRILAANAVIFDQSKVAQGDFARTSDGLANQQRILAASFQEAQTSLGTALLPAITTLVSFANENLIPILNDTIDKVGPQLADAIVEVTPSILKLAESSADLLPPLIDLGVAVLPPLVDLLVLLTPLIIDWTTNTSSAWTVLSGLVSFLAGDTTFEEFTATVMGVGGSMAELSRAVGTALGTAQLNFRKFVTEVRVNVLNFLADIGAIPGKVISALAGAGSWLVSTGQNIISGLISGVRSMASSAINAVINVGRDMLNGIKGFLGIRSPSLRFDLEVGVQSAEGAIGGFVRRMREGRGRMADAVNPEGLSGSPAALAAAPSMAGGVVVQIGQVVLDATNVKSFMDVVDMVANLPQVARAGRGPVMVGG